MITLTNFSCGYDNSIIKDLTLDIASHLCILGPNGAGKSTLAKALCGLLKFSGTYEIDGQMIKAGTKGTLEHLITYVPSKLELYDTQLNVYDYVLLGRYGYLNRIKGFDTSDHAAAENALALLGIQALSQHNVHALSSGQKQLVMIAQALAQESDTVIFDEPTSNLDPLHQKNITKLLQTLMLTKRVILITHDLNAARTFKQSVLFIEKEHCTFYNDSDTFFTPQMLAYHYKTPFIVTEKYVGVSYA